MRPALSSEETLRAARAVCAGGDVCVRRARVLIRARRDAGVREALPLLAAGCVQAEREACQLHARHLLDPERRGAQDTRALRSFERACRLGAVASCVAAANMWALGRGAPVDAGEAARWHRRAQALYGLQRPARAFDAMHQSYALDVARPLARACGAAPGRQAQVWRVVLEGSRAGDRQVLRLIEARALAAPSVVLESNTTPALSCVAHLLQKILLPGGAEARTFRQHLTVQEGAARPHTPRSTP